MACRHRAVPRVAAQGQSKVPAAHAQIIFSSLPLWSALFAGLLLQGDKMGVLGWMGGLSILAAGVFASRRPKSVS